MRHILSILIVLVLFSCNSISQSSKVQVLESAAYADSIKNGVQLIDVRTPEEYANGHIPNSLNINWNDQAFESNVQKLDKDKPVYLYCMSGGRSSIASSALSKLGFKQIYDLKGGIMAWNNAGLQITTSTTTSKVENASLSLEEYTTLSTSSKVVLIDFNAPWCAPCKKMAPMFDELKKEYKNKVDIQLINADDQKELTKQLQIQSLPTMLLYVGGKMVWKHSGFIEKAELVKILNQHQ